MGEFILLQHKRYPEEIGKAEGRRFLTHLAVNQKVTASTQNQTLSVLLLLYRNVLSRELGQFPDVERAKVPPRLPVVFTREEVRAMLSQLEGMGWLMASQWERRYRSKGTVFAESRPDAARSAGSADRPRSRQNQVSLEGEPGFVKRGVGFGKGRPIQRGDPPLIIE